MAEAARVIGSIPLSQDSLASLAQAGQADDEDKRKNDFITAILGPATDAAKQLGVDPRAIIAQAALESNWGSRRPADSSGGSNNLFGIKASPNYQGKSVTSATTEYAGGVPGTQADQFRAYGSVADSIHDYVNLLKSNPRYAAALNTGTDVHKFADALQAGGYATDPEYGHKISAIADQLVQVPSPSQVVKTIPLSQELVNANTPARRVSLPSPHTVPEDSSGDPAPSGMLGGLMQADHYKMPEYNTRLTDSVQQTLSDESTPASLSSMWDVTKNTVEKYFQGRLLEGLEEVEQAKRQGAMRPGTSPFTEAMDAIKGKPLVAPSQEELTRDPNYVELQDSINKSLTSGRQSALAIKQAYDANPSLLSHVMLGAAGGAPAAVATIGTLIGTRNPAAAAAVAYQMTEPGAYSDLRTAGVDPQKAGTHATLQGLISGLSQTIPMGTALKYGTPFFNRLLHTIGATVPAVSADTILSEINRYAATLPHDMTLGDWRDAVERGVIQLPEALTTAIGQGAVLAGAGHFAQKYEPGASFTPETSDFIRAGAGDPGPIPEAETPWQRSTRVWNEQMAAHQAAQADAASAPPKTLALPAPSSPDTMAAPPVSGSPPPDQPSPTASAPISETGQGAAIPPVQPATTPAAEQTTAPAPSAPAPVQSAAPPASPAPSVPKPTPVPQTQPASTTAQEPPAGGAATETTSLKDRIAALRDERDASDERRPVGTERTPLEWAIHSASLGAARSEEDTRQSVIDAIDGGRPDVAQVLVEKAERDAAKAAQQKPGVPSTSPKFEEIKQTLAERARAAEESAVRLRRLMESRTAQKPEAAAPVAAKQSPPAPKVKGTGKAPAKQAGAPAVPTEHIATTSKTPRSARVAEQGTLPTDTEGIDVQETQLDPKEFARLFGQQSTAAADTGTGGQTPARPSVPAPANDVARGRGTAPTGERPDTGEGGRAVRYGGPREDTGRTANNDQPPRVDWREKTAIRGKDGEPLQIWRGSGEEAKASDFAFEALGHATDKPAAGLGVFHTAKKSNAAEYGTPRPAYLDIRNPVTYTVDKRPTWGSKQEAYDFARQLEAQGHDGIVLDHSSVGYPNWYVAFHPDQVIHDPGEAKPATTPDEEAPSTEGYDVQELADAPESRPELKDQPDAPAAGTPGKDPLPAIAARKAQEGRDALARQAAMTPAIAGKRDTTLGRSSFDSMWRDLAPQAQVGETPQQHAKRVEAWTERMRNAPVEQQIAIAKNRTERVFGFKEISIDPKLNKREALDVLLDGYNNLSNHSAMTAMPAEAMGFNGNLSLRLAYRLTGNARGTFYMKFGRPFGDTAVISLSRRSDSFVHEHMHALDFNLLTRYFKGNAQGLSEKTALGTSTLRQNKKQVEEGEVAPLPEPIRKAYLDLMRSIYLTDDASVQKIGQMSLDLQTGKDELAKAQEKLKYVQDLSNKESAREQRAIELDRQAAATKDKFKAAGLTKAAATIRARNAKLEGDIKAARAVVDKSQAKVAGIVKDIHALVSAKASHLLQGSLYVDKLSGGDPYYSLPTELMARAGESWIGNRIGQQGGAEFLSGAPNYYNENSSRLMQLVYPNAVDRTRINQALEDLFSTLATEQYFEGDTHASRIPGDTRIDKELWEADKTQPKVGLVRRALEGTVQDIHALGKVFATITTPEKAVAALKVAGDRGLTVLNALAEIPRIYYSGRGRIMSLRGKYKDNGPLAAAIKRVGALVTTDPGSTDVQGVTLEREVAQKAQARINRVAKISEKHNLNMDDPLQMDQLHEELVRPTEQVRNELEQSLDDVRAQLEHYAGDRNKEVQVARGKQQVAQIEQYLAHHKKPPATPEHIRKGADAMRNLYDEIFYDAESAGIKLGYVSNYQRRTLNRDAVEADPKKFLERAQGVYEFEQLRELRRLQKEIDGVEAETSKWRAVERRTGNELPRTKVLHERAAQLRMQAAEVMALNPAHQAEEYLYAARTGEMFRFDAATPPSKFVKERKFGPIADILLSDFYEKNPIESMFNYAAASTRRIAYARRFGDDHSKRRVMMNELRSHGMMEKDIDELNQTINVLAGYHSAQVSHNQRLALDLLYNGASMALLPLNIFNQLAEPLTAGLRTGRIRDGLINLGYTIQAVAGTGDSEDIRVIADAIGAISRSGHDMIAMSRLDGADMSRLSRWWMAQYQRRTGVHGYTNASRQGTLKLAGMYIKSVADGYLSGDKKKMETAAGLLKELGIEPADHGRFSDYAQARGNLISLDELQSPENHDLKQQYIHALHGFIDGVIGSPKASDKSLLSAHPVARFLTALTAFNMYFQRHHLIRHAKMIGREAMATGAAAKKLGGPGPKMEAAAETAKAAYNTTGAAMRFLLPMLGLMVGAYAQRILRDLYADRQRAKKRLENLASVRTLTDAADLAGASGNFSQFYNYVSPNRYDQKSLLQTLAGSHFSFYADAADDIKTGVQDTKDPNDTSNAAERAAARALYRLSVNTLAPPLLTGLGLNGPLGFIAQSQSMARSTQEGFANWVAPPTVSERYRDMQKMQKAADDAILTPAERAALAQDKAETRADREELMQEELGDSETGVNP